MKFEWDPVKAEKNAPKHGVDFEVAARVFLDPMRSRCLTQTTSRMKTVGE
ncbi:BrnT family toxin [Nitratidesulfovibrio sp. 1201_IL3209]